MPVLPRSRLLLVVALAVLVLLVERLVVTDAEAVESTAEALGEAAATGDWAAFEDLLDPDFSYAGRDRAGTVAWLRRLVERHRPTGIRVRPYEVTVEGDEARARVVVSGSAYGRPQEAAVQATFRRVDDRWRLAAAR